MLNIENIDRCYLTRGVWPSNKLSESGCHRNKDSSVSDQSLLTGSHMVASISRKNEIDIDWLEPESPIFLWVMSHTLSPVLLCSQCCLLACFLRSAQRSASPLLQFPMQLPLQSTCRPCRPCSTDFHMVLSQ